MLSVVIMLWLKGNFPLQYLEERNRLRVETFEGTEFHIKMTVRNCSEFRTNVTRKLDLLIRVRVKTAVSDTVFTVFRTVAKCL